MLLEEAWARLGTHHPALECRVAARLAAALQPAPDPAVPIAMAKAAIERARATGDDAVLCEALLLGGSAMTSFCDELETEPLARELLALATRRSDTAVTLRALARLVHDQGTLGEVHDYGSTLDRMLRMARGIGHPRLAWRPLLLGSMDALARGDFAESERSIAEVRALARLTDDPALTLSLAAHSFSAATATDREDAAREALVDAIGSGGVPSRVTIEALLGSIVGTRFRDAELVERSLARVSFATIVQVFSGAMLLLFAEGYAVVGTAEQCRVLHAKAVAHREREIYFGHVAMSYEGPVARVLGLLELRFGDHGAAEQSLRAALDRCRAGARPPWIARIALELAELLRDRGRADEAAVLAAEAGTIANHLGMAGLARRAAHIDTRVVPADPQPISTTPAAVSMRQVGDAWELRWGERTLHVPDRRGLALLARLVERPCEEIHVLVLAADGGAPLPESSAGEAIDAEAASNYRERLREIEEEIERDPTPARERLAAWERERDFLLAELGRAVGLGGALRKIGSSSERARVNVQRRLKDAIARIERADPALGSYLRAGIRTGTYCTFRP